MVSYFLKKSIRCLHRDSTEIILHHGGTMSRWSCRCWPSKPRQKQVPPDDNSFQEKLDFERASIRVEAFAACEPEPSHCNSAGTDRHQRGCLCRCDHRRPVHFDRCGPAERCQCRRCRVRTVFVHICDGNRGRLLPGRVRALWGAHVRTHASL